MNWNALIQFYSNNKKYTEAYEHSKRAFKKFPNNYHVELVYAKALVGVKKYGQSIAVLKNTNVLPSELGRASRNIYNDAHLFLSNEYIQQKKYSKAIQLLNDSKKWPENLGVGKPYDVDNRIQDYLLAVCFGKLKDVSKQNNLLEGIINYTNTKKGEDNINKLFALLALKKLNRNSDLNDLVSTLNKPNPSYNNSNKLALALFKNDVNQLENLRKESNISESLWEMLSNASEL